MYQLINKINFKLKEFHLIDLMVKNSKPSN